MAYFNTGRGITVLLLDTVREAVRICRTGQEVITQVILKA
jgi:hypothetical protein